VLHVCSTMICSTPFVQYGPSISTSLMHSHTQKAAAKSGAFCILASDT
jgi:hypothetical protein